MKVLNYNILKEIFKYISFHSQTERKKKKKKKRNKTKLNQDIPKS